MKENFPQSNPCELVQVYIEGELKKVEISLRQINIDFLSSTCTVTTDKEVPKEIISSIHEYGSSKGITIEFLTSG